MNSGPYPTTSKINFIKEVAYFLGLCGITCAIPYFYTIPTDNLMMVISMSLAGQMIPVTGEISNILRTLFQIGIGVSFKAFFTKPEMTRTLPWFSQFLPQSLIDRFYPAVPTALENFLTSCKLAGLIGLFEGNFHFRFLKNVSALFGFYKPASPKEEIPFVAEMDVSLVRKFIQGMTPLIHSILNGFLTIGPLPLSAGLSYFALGNYCMTSVMQNEEEIQSRYSCRFVVPHTSYVQLKEEQAKGEPISLLSSPLQWLYGNGKAGSQFVGRVLGISTLGSTAKIEAQKEELLELFSASNYRTQSKI